MVVGTYATYIDYLKYCCCRRVIIHGMLPSGARTQTVARKTLVQTQGESSHAVQHRRQRGHLRCHEESVSEVHSSGTHHRTVLGQRMIAAFACGIIANTGLGVQSAQALLASPNTQIPRTAEAALRRSIPAFNDNVYELQRELESVQYKLRIPQRKPWQDMYQSVTQALERTSDDSSMLQGVLEGDEKEAQEIVDGIKDDLQRLIKAIDAKDPDRTSIRVANALERVGNLELLQTPGLRFPIPSKYNALPRLIGRAVCEFTIQKRNGGEPFYVNEKAGSSTRVNIQVTLDGFSAPLTAGRFAKNVKDGKYDQQILRVDATSIFGETSKGSKQSRELPLELLARGDFEPTYRYSLDVSSGEVPVLPLSIYGSVAMTKTSYDGYSSPSEFFIFKYNRQQSGLSGFSFDEGQFGVFGYVTSNDDVLRQIEDGDILVKATIAQGGDKLVIPDGSMESESDKIGTDDDSGGVLS